MSKIHLVIPDPHAHYQHHNKRAEWVGRLIADLKPDEVINMGDGADMPSLSSYDRGKGNFSGRTYKQDIDAWLDFDDRMWHYIRKLKKKRPTATFLEGNHEERMKRAVNIQPELEGMIGLHDMNLKKNYHRIVEYKGSTPGVINIDGINYAHYFISGIMGRPIGGLHPAYSLLTKEFRSCTSGHIHVLDFCERTAITGDKQLGLVCGVFQDYDSDWAGEINKLWWRGVIIKRNVENGYYDPEFISIERLRKEYGE